MNEQHWEELIVAWEENRLTGEELAEFKRHVAADPQARRRLVETGVLGSIAEARARAWDNLGAVGPLAVAGDNRARWFQWRPLTAAAAGLVFGMFCTSMVWAYAVHERRSSLLRESFERSSFHVDRGFPTHVDQWSGDAATIVSSDAGVRPKDGARMLKMEPVAMELFSRTHCIVDLQKQTQALGSTTRQIEFRASFHPSVLDKKDRYVLRAAAFADEPTKLDERWMKELWPEIDEHALAYAARGVSVPSGTDGWQTITLMIDVPPGSRILVISKWAATMDGKPANRAAHYLDDVRLSGVINDPLP